MGDGGQVVTTQHEAYEDVKPLHDEQTQPVLELLKKGPLAKLDWETNGSRLAPVIEQLRNYWGYDIGGRGTLTNPYSLANRDQTRVMVTEEMKNDYYNSQHWASVRSKRLRLDNHKCTRCKAVDHALADGVHVVLQVHHWKYDLFDENILDLSTLCKACHYWTHRLRGVRLGFPKGTDPGIAYRLERLAYAQSTLEFPGVEPYTLNKNGDQDEFAE